MLWSFTVASVVIVLVPGVDMALVTRQVLRHGRGAAFATLAGLLTAGLTHVALASAGLSALLAASTTAYNVVRAVGATYLVVLGARTLWAARRHDHSAAALVCAPPRPRMPPRQSFLLGLTSNLTNPKMAVFFLTFLPQFVPPGPQAPERTALLGLVFNAIASSWWVTYVLLLHRADALLQRPRVQHALERVTGLVLIGLGLRLATQHPWPGTSSGPVP